MKFKLKIYFYFWILMSGLLNCLQCVHGQGSERESEKNREIQYCQIAILAIGPKPPRRFSEFPEESASVLLPPRAGEIPPKRLYLNNMSIDESEQVQLAINVSFNNPPSFITIPANKTFQLYREKSTIPEVKDRAKIPHYLIIDPLEPGSKSLIILLPSSPSPHRWKSEPKQKVVGLTSSAFTNKRLTLMNFSRRTIKSKYHEAQTLISSGERVFYSEDSKLDLHRISAHYGRENKVIIDTALKLNQSDLLTLYIFYDANPNTNDGRSVDLLRVRIRQ